LDPAEPERLNKSFTLNELVAAYMALRVDAETRTPIIS
jgi:hypothetical protein